MVSRVAWYRLLVIAGAIALLEVLSVTGVIDKITMQAPHLIARDLYRMLVSGRMNGAITKTLGNTMLALGLALGVGIIAGALLHRWRALREMIVGAFITRSSVGICASHLWQSARNEADSPRLSHWLDASAHWPLVRIMPPSEPTKK